MIEVTAKPMYQYFILERYKMCYQKDFNVESDNFRCVFQTYLKDRAEDRYYHLTKSKATMKDYRLYRFEDKLDDNIDDIPWLHAYE